MGTGDREETLRHESLIGDTSNLERCRAVNSTRDIVSSLCSRAVQFRSRLHVRSHDEFIQFDAGDRPGDVIIARR